MTKSESAGTNECVVLFLFLIYEVFYPLWMLNTIWITSKHFQRYITFYYLKHVSPHNTGALQIISLIMSIQNDYLARRTERYLYEG